jgi:hypothetical protein
MLSYKKDAFLVFVLLTLLFAYFYEDSGANGNSRMGLVFAAVQEHRLTIDSFHATPDLGTKDKAYYNGHYYSDKAIGSSVVGYVFYLPMYLLMQVFNFSMKMRQIKYLLVLFSIAIPSAFSGSLMYVLAKYISGSKLKAYIATLCIYLGTMYFPYSTIFYGHTLAASFLLCAFFLIFQLKIRPDLRQNNPYLFLIGFLLGFSIITEFPTILIVLVLVFYYFYVLMDKWSWRDFLSKAIPPAIGGLIPLLLLLAYNNAIFGHPFQLTYSHVSNPFFSEKMSQGLSGIAWPRPIVMFYSTLHPANGLFWQSPVLLMALVGAYFMLRDKQYRAEAIIFIVIFLSYLALISGYYLWWGGYAFGPRHLIPMLPFFVLPIVFVPKRLFPWVVILGLISIAQMFIVVASQIKTPDDMLYKIAELRYFEYSTIYSYCLKKLLSGDFHWNLGQALLGLKTWASLLPAGLAIVAVSGIFIGFERADEKRSNTVKATG